MYFLNIPLFLTNFVCYNGWEIYFCLPKTLQKKDEEFIMTNEELRQLQLTACDVRKCVLTATHSAKSGHPGGSLSAADLFTYLYFHELRIDPKNPKWEDRDRFVLSKGHTAPGLYAALALRGYFPEEDLLTLKTVGDCVRYLTAKLN